MRQLRIVRKSLAIAAILLSPSASPARPDGVSTGNNREITKLCYCDCDRGSGAPMCHRLCELPKYEHRSWATSCHTRPTPELNQTSPAQPTPSKRTNRVEHARLN